MPQKQLVLASTSPYRRELLGRLGLPFIVANPATTEANDLRERLGMAARAHWATHHTMTAAAGAMGVTQPAVAWDGKIYPYIPSPELQIDESLEVVEDWDLVLNP